MSSKLSEKSVRDAKKVLSGKQNSVKVLEIHWDRKLGEAHMTTFWSPKDPIEKKHLIEDIRAFARHSPFFLDSKVEKKVSEVLQFKREGNGKK